MITPTIHLNGSSRDRLVEGQLAILCHLREAERAMFEANPNGRDYYPQGDGALKQAQAEHVARLAKLKALMVEVCELVEAIQDAP
jgi:hypothetical protein